MKKSLLILLSLLASMATASPASAKQLSLQKFVTKAKSQIGNVLSTSVTGGEVLFQDGAGSTNLLPIYDYASLFFVAEGGSFQNFSEGVRVAYRLSLQGFEEIVLVNITPSGQSGLLVYKAGESIITLTDNADPAVVDQLIKDAQLKVQGASIQNLKEIGVIVVNSEVTDMIKILNVISSSHVVKDVSLSEETYRVPFTFDEPVRMQQVGSINPDDFRTVTAELKAQGLPFTTETTIPKELCSDIF